MVKVFMYLVATTLGLLGTVLLMQGLGGTAHDTLLFVGGLISILVAAVAMAAGSAISSKRK